MTQSHTLTPDSPALDMLLLAAMLLALPLCVGAAVVAGHTETFRVAAAVGLGLIAGGFLLLASLVLLPGLVRKLRELREHEAVVRSELRGELVRAAVSQAAGYAGGLVGVCAVAVAIGMGLGRVARVVLGA